MDRYKSRNPPLRDLRREDALEGVRFDLMESPLLGPSNVQTLTPAWGEYLLEVDFDPPVKVNKTNAAKTPELTDDVVDAKRR